MSLLRISLSDNDLGQFRFPCGNLPRKGVPQATGAITFMTGGATQFLELSLCEFLRNALTQRAFAFT